MRTKLSSERWVYKITFMIQCLMTFQACSLGSFPIHALDELNL